MTIDELTNIQHKFDAKHKGTFCWDEKISDDNLQMLEFLMIALMGEVGESANIVKKIVRGDYKLKEKKDALADEMADIFAYLLKLSYQLGIDIEKVYIEKLEKNQERFQNYEIQ